MALKVCHMMWLQEGPIRPDVCSGEIGDQGNDGVNDERGNSGHRPVGGGEGGGDYCFFSWGACLVVKKWRSHSKKISRVLCIFQKKSPNFYHC